MRNKQAFRASCGKNVFVARMDRSNAAKMSSINHWAWVCRNTRHVVSYTSHVLRMLGSQVTRGFNLCDLRRYWYILRITRKDFWPQDLISKIFHALPVFQKNHETRETVHRYILYKTKGGRNSASSSS